MQPDPSDLGDLAAFIALAESNSFAAAGRLLERDATVISRRLQSLEGRLGVRLVERTTRRVALTEAGLAYLARVRPALEDLRTADQEAAAFADGEPRGHLRVSLPDAFGRVWLKPLIVGFLLHHPRVSIETVSTNRYVDLVGERFDLAVRLGNLPDSRIIARKVAERRRLLCASPAYLARGSAIRSPADLAAHDCLCSTGRGEARRWTFADAGSGGTSLAVEGRISSDDVELLVEACLSGLGILHVTDWYVRRELASGHLVEVLPESPLVAAGAVYVVTPASSGTPNKTRAFSDWLARGLAAPPWSASDPEAKATPFP